MPGRGHGRFVSWYNHEHRHTGLALMAPATVHYGLAGQVDRKTTAGLAGCLRATSGTIRERSADPAAATG